MKKILTIALLAILSLTASAQKLPLFDNIENITKENHDKHLPCDFITYTSVGENITYTNGNDFLNFSFKGNKLVFVSINNADLAGIKDLEFINFHYKGKTIKWHSYKDKLIVEKLAFNNKKKWLFYSINNIDEKIKKNPEKYML